MAGSWQEFKVSNQIGQKNVELLQGHGLARTAALTHRKRNDEWQRAAGLGQESLRVEEVWICPDLGVVMHVPEVKGDQTVLGHVIASDPGVAVDMKMESSRVEYNSISCHSPLGTVNDAHVSNTAHAQHLSNKGLQVGALRLALALDISIECLLDFWVGGQVEHGKGQGGGSGFRTSSKEVQDGDL